MESQAVKLNQQDPQTSGTPQAGGYTRVDIYNEAKEYTSGKLTRRQYRERIKQEGGKEKLYNFLAYNREKAGKESLPPYEEWVKSFDAPIRPPEPPKPDPVDFQRNLGAESLNLKDRSNPRIKMPQAPNYGSDAPNPDDPNFQQWVNEQDDKGYNVAMKDGSVISAPIGEIPFDKVADYYPPSKDGSVVTEQSEETQEVEPELPVDTTDTEVPTVEQQVEPQTIEPPAELTQSPPEEFTGYRFEKEEHEDAFKKNWNSDPNILSWRKWMFDEYGEDPSPDNPQYNYRKAWVSGLKPQINENGEWHWGSKAYDGTDLKSINHPTRWKSDFYERFGYDPDLTGIEKKDGVKMLQDWSDMDAAFGKKSMTEGKGDEQPLTQTKEGYQEDPYTVPPELKASMEEQQRMADERKSQNLLRLAGVSQEPSFEEISRGEEGGILQEIDGLPVNAQTIDLHVANGTSKYGMFFLTDQERELAEVIQKDRAALGKGYRIEDGEFIIEDDLSRGWSSSTMSKAKKLSNGWSPLVLPADVTTSMKVAEIYNESLNELYEAADQYRDLAVKHGFSYDVKDRQWKEGDQEGGLFAVFDDKNENVQRNIEGIYNLLGFKDGIYPQHAIGASGSGADVDYGSEAWKILHHVGERVSPDFTGAFKGMNELYNAKSRFEYAAQSFRDISRVYLTNNSFAEVEDTGILDRIWEKTRESNAGSIAPKNAGLGVWTEEDSRNSVFQTLYFSGLYDQMKEAELLGQDLYDDEAIKELVDLTGRQPSGGQFAADMTGGLVGFLPTLMITRGMLMRAGGAGMMRSFQAMRQNGNWIQKTQAVLGMALMEEMIFQGAGGQGGEGFGFALGGEATRHLGKVRIGGKYGGVVTAIINKMMGMGATGVTMTSGMKLSHMTGELVNDLSGDEAIVRDYAEALGLYNNKGELAVSDAAMHTLIEIGVNSFFGLVHGREGDVPLSDFIKGKKREYRKLARELEEAGELTLADEIYNWEATLDLTIEANQKAMSRLGRRANEFQIKEIRTDKTGVEVPLEREVVSDEEAPVKIEKGKLVDTKKKEKLSDVVEDVEGVEKTKEYETAEKNDVVDPIIELAFKGKTEKQIVDELAARHNSKKSNFKLKDANGIPLKGRATKREARKMVDATFKQKGIPSMGKILKMEAEFAQKAMVSRQGLEYRELQRELGEKGREIDRYKEILEGIEGDKKPDAEGNRTESSERARVYNEEIRRLESEVEGMEAEMAKMPQEKAIQQLGKNIEALYEARNHWRDKLKPQFYETKPARYKYRDVPVENDWIVKDKIDVAKRKWKDAEGKNFRVEPEVRVDGKVMTEAEAKKWIDKPANRERVLKGESEVELDFIDPKSPLAQSVKRLNTKRRPFTKAAETESRETTFAQAEGKHAFKYNPETDTYERGRLRKRANGWHFRSGQAYDIKNLKKEGEGKEVPIEDGDIIGEHGIFLADPMAKQPKSGKKEADLSNDGKTLEYGDATYKVVKINKGKDGNPTSVTAYKVNAKGEREGNPVHFRNDDVLYQAKLFQNKGQIRDRDTGDFKEGRGVVTKELREGKEGEGEVVETAGTEEVSKTPVKEEKPEEPKETENEKPVEPTEPEAGTTEPTTKPSGESTGGTDGGAKPTGGTTRGSGGKSGTPKGEKTDTPNEGETGDTSTDTGTGERPVSTGGTGAKPRTKQPRGSVTRTTVTRPANVEGDGGEGRPPLHGTDYRDIPTPTSHVKEGKYEVDEHQLFAINAALTNFYDNGREGFVLADGTGVGKSRALLGTAREIADRSGKPVLIVTENKQVVNTSLIPEAKRAGIDLDNLELVTYSGIKNQRTGELKEKYANKEYGAVIFDEAHNLKNSMSAKSVAGQSIKAEKSLFATATPMDRPTGATYFLAKMLNRSQEDVMGELGYEIVQKETANGTKYDVAQPKKGFSWAKVFENMLAMRDQAEKEGAFVRRNYPFYGEIEEMRHVMEFYDESLLDILEDNWQNKNEGNKHMTMTGELSRLTEKLKTNALWEQVFNDLVEGKKVVVVAEGVEPTVLRGLSTRSYFSNRINMIRDKHGEEAAKKLEDVFRMYDSERSQQVEDSDLLQRLYQERVDESLEHKKEVLSNAIIETEISLLENPRTKAILDALDAVKADKSLPFELRALAEEMSINANPVKRNMVFFEKENRRRDKTKPPREREGVIVNPLIKELGERLKEELGENAYAEVYGQGNKSAEVDRFQNDEVDVLMATPKSGGTGISLDDQVGDAPRQLYMATANYAGDQFQQILGRVSRKNTKSPSKATIMFSVNEFGDLASNEGKRAEILQKKMEVLKAIQEGADPDAAAGMNTGEGGEPVIVGATTTKGKQVPLTGDAGLKPISKPKPAEPAPKPEPTSEAPSAKPKPAAKPTAKPKPVEADTSVEPKTKANQAIQAIEAERARALASLDKVDNATEKQIEAERKDQLENPEITPEEFRDAVSHMGEIKWGVPQNFKALAKSSELKERGSKMAAAAFKYLDGELTPEEFLTKENGFGEFAEDFKPKSDTEFLRAADNVAKVFEPQYNRIYEVYDKMLNKEIPTEGSPFDFGGDKYVTTKKARVVIHKHFDERVAEVNDALQAELGKPEEPYVPPTPISPSEGRDVAAEIAEIPREVLESEIFPQVPSINNGLKGVYDTGFNQGKQWYALGSYESNFKDAMFDLTDFPSIFGDPAAYSRNHIYDRAIQLEKHLNNPIVIEGIGNKSNRLRALEMMDALNNMEAYSNAQRFSLELINDVLTGDIPEALRKLEHIKELSLEKNADQLKEFHKFDLVDMYERGVSPSLTRAINKHLGVEPEKRTHGNPKPAPTKKAIQHPEGSYLQDPNTGEIFEVWVKDGNVVKAKSSEEGREIVELNPDVDYVNIGDYSGIDLAKALNNPTADAHIQRLMDKAGVRVRNEKDYGGEIEPPKDETFLSTFDPSEYADKPVGVVFTGLSESKAAYNQRLELYEAQAGEIQERIDQLKEQGDPEGEVLNLERQIKEIRNRNLAEAERLNKEYESALTKLEDYVGARADVQLNFYDGVERKSFVNDFHHLTTDESMAKKSVNEIVDELVSLKKKLRKTEADNAQAPMEGEHVATEGFKEAFMQESDRVVKGYQTRVAMPDGSFRDARYVVVEAEDIAASHLLFADRAVYNPLFPQQKGIATINSRDYAKDEAARLYTWKEAQRLQPEQLISNALEPAVGMPVISIDGVVKSGNGRVMMYKTAINEGTTNGYREYLLEKSDQYGIKKSEIEHMANPMLVRVDLTRGKRYSVKEMDAFNEAPMKAQTEADRAIVTAKMFAGEEYNDTRKGITDLLNRKGADGQPKYSTFSDFFADKEAAEVVVAQLIEAGVIKAKERHVYVNKEDGKLTKKGKMTIQAVLQGGLFDEIVVGQLLDGNLKNLNDKKIGGLLVPLYRLGGLEKRHDLTPYVNDALKLISEHRSEGGAQSLTQYIIDPKLFQEEIYAEEAKVLAVLLAENVGKKQAYSQREIKSFLETYIIESENARREGTLAFEEFAGEVNKTRMERLEDIARSKGMTLVVDMARKATEVANEKSEMIRSNKGAGEIENQLVGNGIPMNGKLGANGVLTASKMNAIGTFKDVADQLVKDLGLEYGTDIRLRNTGRKETLGFFEHRTKIIRFKNPTDFKTLAHEIGHRIDITKMFGVESGSELLDFKGDDLLIIKAHKNGDKVTLQGFRDTYGDTHVSTILHRADVRSELMQYLKDVDHYYQKNDITGLREGMAEFLSDYITRNEVARAKAPLLYEFYQKTFLQEPTLHRAIETARHKAEMIRNSDYRINDMNMILYDQIKAPVSQAIKFIREGDALGMLFDSERWIRNITERQLEKNPDLDTKDQAIFAALSARGSAGKVHQFINRRPFTTHVRPDGTIHYEFMDGVKPLRKILGEAVDKADVERVDLILAYHRSMEMFNISDRAQTRYDELERKAKEAHRQIRSATDAEGTVNLEKGELAALRADISRFELEAPALKKKISYKNSSINPDKASVEAALEKFREELGSDLVDGLKTDLSKYNNVLLEYARNAGILNDAQITGMKNDSEFYISFRRKYEEWDARFNREHLSMGGSSLDAQAKDLISSFREKEAWVEDRIAPPIQSIFEHTQNIITRADQNSKKLAIIDALVSLGEAQKMRATKDNANVISVWRNGKVEHYDVPHHYMAEFNRRVMTHDPSTLLIKKPIELIRKGAVTHNPEFAIKNIARDQVSAMFYSKHSYNAFLNPVTAAKGAGRAWLAATGVGQMVSDRLGLKDNLTDQWYASGSAMSTLTEVLKAKEHSFNALDREYDMVKLAENLSERVGKPMSTENIAKYNNYVEFLRKTAKGANRWSLGLLGSTLEGFSTVSEMSTRLAAFDHAYKRTGDVLKAMEESRQIAADYGQVGNAKLIWLSGMVTPFINANLQHMYETGGALSTKQRIARTGAIGSMIAASSMFNWAMNNILLDDYYGEEGYDGYGSKVSDLYQGGSYFDKMYNWRVWNPMSKTFMSVPKGTFGLDFGTTIEAMMDDQVANDSRLSEGLGATILRDHFAPMRSLGMGNMQSARVGMILFGNKDIFTMKNVEPQWLETLEPFARYDDRTPASIKEFSHSMRQDRREWTSPKRLDKALKAGIGGGYYDMFVAMDKGLQATGLVEPNAPSLRDLKFQLPITRSLFEEPAVGQRSSFTRDFYDHVKEAEELVNTRGKYLEELNMPEFMDYHNNKESAEREAKMQFYLLHSMQKKGDNVNKHGVIDNEVQGLKHNITNIARVQTILNNPDNLVTKLLFLGVPKEQVKAWNKEWKEVTDRAISAETRKWVKAREQFLDGYQREGVKYVDKTAAGLAEYHRKVAEIQAKGGDPKEIEYQIDQLPQPEGVYFRSVRFKRLGAIKNEDVMKSLGIKGMKDALNLRK